MIIQVVCPCCGAFTEVELIDDETVKFLGNSKTLPPDINRRSICQCCTEHGITGSDALTYSENQYKKRRRKDIQYEFK